MENLKFPIRHYEKYKELIMQGLEVKFEVNDVEIESELRVNLKKFSQAVIWGTDWTTETIARQLEKGNIDLNPSFQRRDAWSDKEKSRLIESLMLGLPVPPIILAESKTKKNSYIVIDGKQRLLSIRRFYSKISEKEFKEKGLNEKNVFKQLKLRGLDILTEFNGKTYNKIEEDNIDYINNLDNQSIRTIVIKNWPDEAFLYTVFLRLNTGSKKLSPQELRQALKPGAFLDFLDEATADSHWIKSMLNNKSADPRMKDIELALRYYGFKFFVEEYQGNLKEFLDFTCEQMNMTWEKEETNIRVAFEELENAIEFTEKIFQPQQPFSRYTEGKCNEKFNRAIFEVFTYYFSNGEIRRALENKTKEFKEGFIKLNDDPDFIHSVGDTTKEMKRVEIRFKMIKELIAGLTENDISELQIVNGKIKVIR